MKNTKIVISIILSLLPLIVQAQSEISKTWIADLGNGKYKNPVLYADYSDPDVCRVGEDYYMTASSFNCVPGLPILHSKDLVNWRIVGHAINRMPDCAIYGEGVNHGGNVWAPSIRYHNGEYYIYYGDPDIGIFMTKTKDPSGEWDSLTLVKKGKGLIDPCPLFDDDGQVYLVHAFAGSRAGIKSLLSITRLTSDGKRTIGESRIIYDGHDTDPTIEGPKFYKRNGYYYIFAPAGGVATGWQLAMRSKNVYGPYERKVVMTQDKTITNGPHQGAWIDTPTGEDWFVHFQDVGVFGRVIHLQPMIWKDDWCVIGEDEDKDGCGNPVLTYRKPNVGKTYSLSTPAESDDFNTNTLGLQWQWHSNPQDWWYFANKEKGCLNLYSVPLPDNYKNMWDVPNLLLQKTPASEFTATMKMTLKPDKRFKGEMAGLVVMGLDYGVITLRNEENGYKLTQAECLKADKGNAEKVNEQVNLSDPTVYLKVKVNSKAQCQFYYSIDGRKFIKIGDLFQAREGKWIGAKIGMFCLRPIKGNDGGSAEIDWFRLDK